jgi:hypothetical protein
LRTPLFGPLDRDIMIAGEGLNPVLVVGRTLAQDLFAEHRNANNVSPVSAMSARTISIFVPPERLSYRYTNEEDGKMSRILSVGGLTEAIRA